MGTKKQGKRCVVKLIHCLCLAIFLVSVGLVPDCGIAVYAQSEVGNNLKPAATQVAQTGSDGSIEKLLSKYFRRIDSYLKQQKYTLARNELKKIYLIDPTNAKAQNYENLIARSEQNEVKNDEASMAHQNALESAEAAYREKQDVLDAADRLTDKRTEESWTGEGNYLRAGELDLDEFERLQNLGVDKYKEELIAEAQKYLQQDNYDKAISRYKDALAIDPGDLLIRELVNEAKESREKRMDDILLKQEEIEDREFMQEATKSAMGIDEYRRGMKGHGYAKPRVGYKPDMRPSIYDQMQIPITADFRDVDLSSVLNFLSDYTGINILASQLVMSEVRPISVRFRELPLDRALKYIIKGQGLSYRIDDDLIYIATVEEMETEELETRIYYLEKGSGVYSIFRSSNMGSLGSQGASSSVSGMKSIKELVEDAVPFPPGAKVVFDDRTGALIVTNTPTNLKKIEEILYVVDEPPQQILIESRFIQVDMDEWENLGMEIDLNPGTMHLDQNNDGKFDPAYDFTGVSDAISSETGGLNFTFGGLLNANQYNVVLNAVKRLEKTKTLSAPKITTINNQTATIKVVTEEVFPTRFEVSLIQQDLNGDGDLDDAGETEFANVPQEFVSRDIGIILQVTPSVGVDKRTITLSIVPEVSSVASSPAKFEIANYDSNGNESGSRSSGTPNLPRFTTSTLSTTVVIESGETAVLGGLIKETRGTTEEKIPLLGDIPYIGFLFRSKQDETSRENLIIFITGQVISA